MTNSRPVVYTADYGDVDNAWGRMPGAIEGATMPAQIPDLRKRLSAVLGREVHRGEMQADILLELLEQLEQIATERRESARRTP